MNNDQINEFLSNLYYTQNKKLGAVKLMKIANEQLLPGQKLSTNDVQRWLNLQEDVQVMKPQTRPKEYSSIKSSGVLNNVQCDIFVQSDRYIYRGYRYVLVVIDVYSRFIKMKPMKSRQMQEVSTNLRQIFEEMETTTGRRIQNFNSDQEFNKRAFLDLFREKNIKTYFSGRGETNKNAIVERFMRTLRLYLQKFRLALKHNRWTEYLDDVENLYNTSEHTTTQKKPLDLFQGRGRSEQVHITVENELKEGDLVRIKIKKQIFDKDDVLKYSKKIYLIHQKQGDNLTLKNPEGNILMSSNQPKRFKPYDLILANVVQKDVSQDEDDENDDLQENFEIDEQDQENPRTIQVNQNTGSTSSTTRRSTRIQSRQNESPINISIGDQVQTYWNNPRTRRIDRSTTYNGVVTKIIDNNENRNSIQFLPSQEFRRKQIRFSIQYDNQEEPSENITYNYFVQPNETINSLETRRRRNVRNNSPSFQVGDIVKTYWKNSDNGHTLKNPQGKKIEYTGEIQKIFNSANEEVNRIQLSENEKYPRFDIFYFSDRSIAEKVPFNLFI
jgi:hypothetical protein